MNLTIQAFLKYRHLLSNLIKRDIKVKYRRSVLGVLWSVLNPLLMMAVIVTVFSTLWNNSIPNFPIYYLSGSLLFSFFSDATSQALSSIIGNAPLLKKVYFPKYIFPLERTLFALVNLGFSFIAMLVVLIFMPVQPTVYMLLMPVPILLLFFFSLGVGLILSAVAVFVRDLVHLYGVLLTALMYLTPIFYPFEILPTWAQVIVRANPLYQYIAYFRNVFLYGRAPSADQVFICIVYAVVALVAGLLIFHRMQHKFILYI